MHPVLAMLDGANGWTLGRTPRTGAGGCAAPTASSFPWAITRTGWLRVFSAAEQSPCHAPAPQPVGLVRERKPLACPLQNQIIGRKNMKIKISQFSSLLLFLAVLLTACNGQIAIEPTATIAPTSTETPIPSPTFTPTATPTLPPTETPIPQPASLSGTISLSNDTAKPFGSTVELRQGDSFTLIASSKTDSSGYIKLKI